MRVKDYSTMLVLGSIMLGMAATELIGTKYIYGVIGGAVVGVIWVLMISRKERDEGS